MLGCANEQILKMLKGNSFACFLEIQKYIFHIKHKSHKLGFAYAMLPLRCLHHSGWNKSASSLGEIYLCQCFH